MLQVGAYGGLYDERRSRKLGLGGQGMKANEKSCVEEGEHGVTMMVGRGDFPATSERERSEGAGTSIWSAHWGRRCRRGGTGRCISNLSSRSQRERVGYVLLRMSLIP